MKKSTLCTLLCMEALVCAVLASRPGTSFSAGFMAFPFEQLGDALRKLSLAGWLTNAIAVAMYCAVCLSPAVYLALRVFGRKAQTEDALLALLSILLFFVLYMMVNPADIAKHFGAAELVPVCKVILGAALYTVMAAYAVLRILRSFHQSGTEPLLRHLRVLLSVVSAVLVFALCGAGTLRLTGALETLKAANTDGGNLTASYLFIILQFIVDSLPLVLYLMIVFSGFALIDALKEGMYGEKVVPAARGTARLCRLAIVIIMLSQVAVNTAQLILGRRVRSSDYTLSIPLLPVLFVLAAMLLAHYFEQARALKDDNDMII